MVSTHAYIPVEHISNPEQAQEKKMKKSYASSHVNLSYTHFHKVSTHVQYSKIAYIHTQFIYSGLRCLLLHGNNPLRPLDGSDSAHLTTTVGDVLHYSKIVDTHTHTHIYTE